jgi:hypothetical protein
MYPLSLHTCIIIHVDGSYCEHGREIFDEEAEAIAKDKKGKAKKPVSWVLVRRGGSSWGEGGGGD